MSSSSASAIASQVPRVHVRPRADRTFGDLAADLAAHYGLDPDPWQRLILDDWLGERRGKWGALTCGLAVPRQNGKNGVLEVRELFGMVGRGEKILHTAHEVKTAQKHFRRLKHFFGSRADDPAARFPELNALVSEVRNVNGQEGIFLRNGGSVELVARSKNSGRGFTVDVLVMDEAQEMSEDALEALMPTTSSAPSGNPQWIFTGTPPGPQAVGEVFTRVRAEALTAKPKRLAWHEWSVEGDVDLDDRASWFATNPALGTRLQVDVVEGERKRFSDDGFARERLGRWATSTAVTPLIRAERWNPLRIDAAPQGVVAYGVKFSTDGARASLAVAVRPESGPIHVEVVRSASMAAGNSWLVDWLASRWRDAAVVVIDGKSGAGPLVNALRAKRIPPRMIVTPTLDQVISAHSMLLEAVVGGELTHFGQEGLDDTVAHATKRPIGTAGGWGWQPIGDAVDVTPLEAVTYAHFGAVTSKRKAPGRGEGRRVVVFG